MTLPTRRLRACVEAWPAAVTGAYDPRCCRFPKSCSATVYDEGRVAEEDLEPQPEVHQCAIGGPECPGHASRYLGCREPAGPVFLTHPVVASGWLFIGDHSPAFTQVVAAYLAAHDDVDVREIGARMLAANPINDDNEETR